MDQDRLDYADHDTPPVWVPSLRSLLTVVLIVLLVVVGAFAFFWVAVVVPGIEC